ncbi:MAG: RT0821/Lpp0805 family surface protein [Hyphomicrobiaceae bacterium]
MRCVRSSQADLSTAVLTLLTGCGLVFLILSSASPVRAERESGTAPVTAEPSSAPSNLKGTTPDARKPRLGGQERAHMLEAIATALEEVPDGSTYVWHRTSGGLSAFIKPTAAFADRDGRVCRTIEVTIVLADRERAASGAACRETDGTWRLGTS